jgi:hypothetical protein
MANTDVPAKPIDKAVTAAITELRALERQCFRAKRRFAFYEYLAAVFETYRRLRRRDDEERMLKRLGRRLNIPITPDGHLIRILIDLTSSADPKTKSRWTQALRFAWHERKRWTDFQKFMLKCGGPAGCAERYAALNPKPPKGYIIRSTPGYPVVPIFISPSCWPLGK